MIDLDGLTLDKGSHDSFKRGACLLEAASYMAGEPWTAYPQSVSYVLGVYGRALNDNLPHGKRQELKEFIPALPNTVGDGQDEARTYMSLDWLVRTCTPVYLDHIEWTDEAQGLRSLSRIRDESSARAAGLILGNMRDFTDVEDSVREVVVGVKLIIEWFDIDVSEAVKVYSIRNSVVAAWNDWGTGALSPSAVSDLQDSAIELFGRMIDPSREVPK